MTVGPGSNSSLTFSRTNLKDGVSVSPPNSYWYQQHSLPLEEEKPPIQPDISTEMSFHLLPYDLLLNVASYLEYNDVHCLQLTCKSLYYSFTTRPVYRKLATDLLRRCRPLPLKGFQRLGDLSTTRLIYCVNKAHQYEQAWLVRSPRPIAHEETHNNYLDLEVPEGSAALSAMVPKKWFKVVHAPPGEEVDWLSPITSSYTLCATKSGKVVCWDVQTDNCLAEWNPGERWELWKCRVEFEDKMVYFTMAKVLHGSSSYDDSRVMEFSLMRLQFYENSLGKKTASPTFSSVASFKTVGVVMNIFLLDPSAKLLSAFIWVSSSNTIGLYVLLDWEKEDYVFIDTGIECVMSSNWSCILFERNVVIHCEDSDAAFQHFYPLSILEGHARQLKSKRSTPTLSGRLTPFESIVKRFVFPAPKVQSIRRVTTVNGGIPITVIDSHTGAIITVTTSISVAPHTSAISSTSSTAVSAPSSTSNFSESSSSTSSITSSSSPQAQHIPPPTFIPIPNPNPFPFPPWYPESAHFVRQWWPTLPNVPRISCTVILLASHDPVTHKTRFVLAQHYFRVPMRNASWIGFGERGKMGGGRRGFAANGADDLNGGVVDGNGSVDGGATAGSSTDGTPSSEPMGPMEMYLLDGPPEDSILAPFSDAGAGAGAAGSSSSRTDVPAEADAGAGAESGSMGAGMVIGWRVNSPSGGHSHSHSNPGSSSRPSTSRGKGKGRASDSDPDSDSAAGDKDRDQDHDEAEAEARVEDDALKLWYVSDPFEVVCLEDPAPDDEDGMQERPRPLVAVDFGHAVWIEYFDQEQDMSEEEMANRTRAPSDTNDEDDIRDTHENEVGSERAHEPESPREDDEAEDTNTETEDVDVEAETETEVDADAVHDEAASASGATTTTSRPEEPQEHENKRLRFVTFPPFTDDGRVNDIHGGWGGAEVRTLEVPPELDLHSVETINIDQSQGAIILSVKQGKIFILCYE